MAELNRVDPSDIHAVVVGLESYPHAPASWSLKGAGKAALRFALWLRQGRVPAQNIRLLWSLLDDSDPALVTAAEAEGLDHRVVTSGSEIRNVFTQDLSVARGKLLYVFWGGHGILARQGRLLFLPDAAANDKQALDVEELRDFLTQLARSGFDQQVLFFDACATFVERHQGESPPVVTKFPEPNRATTQQYLLHAARDGQEAEHDTRLGSGVYSAMLLDWLENNASDLHPDLAAFQKDVEKYFEDRCGDDVPSQAPVWRRYLDLGGSGDEKSYVKVDSNARLEVTGVLETVFSELGRCKVYAARVAAAVNYSLSYNSVESFAEMLLGIPRAMANLVELLSMEDNEDAVEQLSAQALRHATPGLLSTSEHIGLATLLTQVPALSPVTVNAITQEVLPGAGGVIIETGRPLDGDQLLTHVEHLERFPGGRSFAGTGRRTAPALIRFVLHLTEILDRNEDVCRDLVKWCRKVARRLAVDDTTLEELEEAARAWARNADQPGNTPRVVVQVYPEADAQEFTCVVWTDPGIGVLSQHLNENNGVPLSPASAVQLIEGAIKSLSDNESSAPVVEIVLKAEDMLTVPVHTWDGAGLGAVLPIRLAVDRRMALRCAPLANKDIEKQRRDRLMERWTSGVEETAIHLNQSHTQGQSAYGRLSKSTKAARVIVCVDSSHRANMINLALYMGYPVVLWDYIAATAVAESHFDSLKPEDALPELPERIRGYWSDVLENPTANLVRPGLVLDYADRDLPPEPPINSELASNETGAR